jgi:hypothetical protein
MVFQASTDTYTAQAKPLKSASLTLLALVASVISPILGAFAQYQESNFVDSFDTVEATASDFHNDRFREAEQALTRGLSQGGQNSSPRRQQPDLKQVSATSPASPQPAVRQVSKVVDLPVQARNELLEDEQFVDGFSDDAPREKAPPPAPHRSTTPKIIKDEPAEPRAMRAVSQEARPSQAPSSNTQQTKTATLKAKQALGALEDRIAASEREALELRKQLSEAKSALAAAELEISRLSSIIQESSRARLNIGEPTKFSRPSDIRPNEAKVKAAQVKTLTSAPESSLATGQDLNSDVQVATISVDKADLRLGPGRNHSALMSLRRGSRLAIEARQGEWYRVFAPNGQRAWIHSSLVRFGDGAASLNDGSSVKVGGYDSKIRQ